ncbi:endoplasmic reticulum mannosyl-oligosaccharide 1,2-alpha-mannosidase-like [Echinops telfairi]|uniref:alpha-1,2-Mannosidase n=1 Tax=Echinops telfairi TaxID=9371 RepID=A0ABM0ZRS6_ECHTE|nr:endoplasmic reticulum mannosyl-oligosaccharide 1,2-alpha-mannosidase-like [Echinops telfairi]
MSTRLGQNALLFLMALLTAGCVRLLHGAVEDPRQAPAGTVSEEQKLELEISGWTAIKSPGVIAPQTSSSDLRDFLEILPRMLQKHVQGRLSSWQIRGLQRDLRNNRRQRATQQEEEGPSPRKLLSLRKALLPIRQSGDRGAVCQAWHSARQVRKQGKPASPTERRAAVVKAFSHAWKGYREFAWGHDELRPASRSFNEVFGVGLTLIDALDTMWIMGLQAEFAEAKKWVLEQLNFQNNENVNLFECTIRVLGGLLSAYNLSGDSLFLEKAEDLGARLLPAFQTHSKLPYSHVNLASGEGRSTYMESSVAQVGSIQLEFRELSRLTGKEKFQEAVDEVMQHIHSLPGKKDGLVPTNIDLLSGFFTSQGSFTVGANVDSYYEYLLKQWIQGGKKDNQLLEDYVEAIKGIQKHLLYTDRAEQLTFVGELHNDQFQARMEHFACFLPGTLALGVHHGLSNDHMELAQALMKTCYQMYQQFNSGLSPEVVYYDDSLPGTHKNMRVLTRDNFNVLRPETVESLFYLYRFTGDKKYQDWGWKILQGFNKHSRIPSGGYSSIFNVQNPVILDHMESFFLAETLKYMYLLFSDDTDLFDLDQYVFNTEAHPLPIWISA